jgi:hypothetical protein
LHCCYEELKDIFNQENYKMNRTILYYPTINIPTNAWLRHAILYWDEVSSIVPRSSDERMLARLSPDILYLHHEGIFRPIKPEDLIYKRDNWEELNSFLKEFGEIIQSPQFQQLLKRRYQSDYRIHIDKLGINAMSKIHRNKTSDLIYASLLEQGLAKIDRQDPEWLLFEKNTALLYMSLLAKYLADIDSNQTTIGTDYSIYEKFNFKRVREDEGFPVVSFSLNHILPSPNPNVPFERILDFKKRRKDNLLHFKKILSEFMTKISKSESHTEYKETAINFQETLIAGVKDLQVVLSESRIETGFKSLKSLINIKSPTMISTLGGFLNKEHNFINLPLDLTVTGICTVGAIELTTNYIESRNKIRAKERESPFSYIYQAQKYGLVSRY